MVGLSQGYDQLVMRGTTESDCFAAFYLKDGYLLAVDTVNRAPEFMLAKRLISERIRVDPCRLADEGIPVKDLLTHP
ncbi:Putidaredoxin reductase [compost metagenome]